MKNLKPVIGMEVHVELKTKSKMFCGCPAKHFHIKPNTHTCPVCLGLPGALPVPNQLAVKWTAMIGLALNCKINKVSRFDRKHYFYPDLPKGYQISQYDQPLCKTGYLNLNSGKKIHITRVHLEEDTGKLVHKKLKGKNVSLVDFNRSGVPLVEIVTEPDISSGEEAKEYLKKIRDIIRSLKVSDCDMEKGSMRLEANISFSLNNKLTYKVEVKNLNSFRYVEQSINYELSRQKKLLKKGTTPKQETRGYNQKTKQTFSQRSKESSEDYRYFPEPDIPPMVFTDKDISGWKSSLPKLPDQHIKELDLPVNTARLLVSKPANLNYFTKNISKAKKLGISPLKLANLVINKKLDIKKSALDQLQNLTQKQTIDSSIIDKIVKENQDAVKKFKAGKTSVIGFLVGQVMKESAGQADPKTAKELIQKAINKT